MDRVLILRVSASIDRLCLKYVMEEGQVLLDKTETDLKMDLKMTTKMIWKKMLHWTYKRNWLIS